MLDQIPILDDIHVVEVVDLSEVAPTSGVNYMAAASSAPFARFEGEEASAFTALWNRLPAGRQARCHVPPFGFRFFNQSELVLQASVCWMCNNISGNVSGDEFWYAFNADAPVSQELLRAAKALFPNAAEPE